MSNNQDSLIEIRFEELKSSKNLPSPTGVALEIIRLTQEPGLALDDLLRPIQSDPALAGRLLKIANSAANVGTTPAISIKDALLRVGTSALANLALSLSILDNNRQGGCPAFDYDSFWQTSLMRGLAMRQIALQLQIAGKRLTLMPEEAFAVGLLCDIGRLALAQIHPELYAECLRNQCGNLLALEQETFLMTHQQISIEMMRDWGMPETILRGVRIAQCEGCLDSGVKLVDQAIELAPVLRLANYLTGELGLDAGIQCMTPIVEHLGLSYVDLVQIRGLLFKEWRSWGELLYLPVDEFNDLFGEAGLLTDANHSSDKLRVLVVDDDRTERQILRSNLASKGYNVFVADNVDAAIAQFILHRPHIVITDYMMQPFDGYVLTRTLRNNQETKEAYIILITASTDSEIMKQAFDAGVNDFIFKPIKSEELDARIAGAVHFIKRQKQQAYERKEILAEAAHLALEKRRFATMATTDPLTGLNNRRYFQARLDQEWARLARRERRFGIISLDLDFFKKINDGYGHDVGDRVLQHFASILKQSIRSEDIACRIGGEEFIVISPDIDQDGLLAVCERIRSRVEALQPLELELLRAVTVSIGATISDVEQDPGPESVLKRSDQALYQAKASGRNRVVVV